MFYSFFHRVIISKVSILFFQGVPPKYRTMATHLCHRSQVSTIMNTNKITSWTNLKQTKFRQLLQNQSPPYCILVHTHTHLPWFGISDITGCAVSYTITTSGYSSHLWKGSLNFWMAAMWTKSKNIGMQLFQQKLVQWHIIYNIYIFNPQMSKNWKHPCFSCCFTMNVSTYTP